MHYTLSDACQCYSILLLYRWLLQETLSSVLIHHGTSSTHSNSTENLTTPLWIWKLFFWSIISKVPHIWFKYVNNSNCFDTHVFFMENGFCFLLHFILVINKFQFKMWKRFSIWSISMCTDFCDVLRMNRSDVWMEV